LADSCLNFLLDIFFFSRAQDNLFFIKNQQ